MPQELDELTRRVLRLEIEETALAKEKDEASARRLDVLRKELAEAREKASSIRKCRWIGMPAPTGTCWVPKARLSERVAEPTLMKILPQGLKSGTPSCGRTANGEIHR